jgi:hypothetical protein
MERGITYSDPGKPLTVTPELALIYKTAPIGLAFLSTDCRYLMINEHLTEICGISIADHIGRSVRETVPQVAEQVEHIVQTILRTGEAITGIEVGGQRSPPASSRRLSRPIQCLLTRISMSRKSVRLISTRIGNIAISRGLHCHRAGSLRLGGLQKFLQLFLREFFDVLGHCSPS